MSIFSTKHPLVNATICGVAAVVCLMSLLNSVFHSNLPFNRLAVTSGPVEVKLDIHGMDKIITDGLLIYLAGEEKQVFEIKGKAYELLKSHLVGAPTITFWYNTSECNAYTKMPVCFPQQIAVNSQVIMDRHTYLVSQHINVFIKFILFSLFSVLSICLLKANPLKIKPIKAKSIKH